MKLFRLIVRPSAGQACVHGLFALPFDAPPLTGIGMFGMPCKPVKPGRPEKRKRLLEYLRAELARRNWRQPA